MEIFKIKKMVPLAEDEQKDIQGGGAGGCASTISGGILCEDRPIGVQGPTP